VPQSCMFYFLLFEVNLNVRMHVSFQFTLNLPNGTW
jgi:hypothetical protein